MHESSKTSLDPSSPDLDTRVSRLEDNLQAATKALDDYRIACDKRVDELRQQLATLAFAVGGKGPMAVYDQLSDPTPQTSILS